MAFAGPAFISYNHADKDFAGWLATELVAHHVAVWYDEWEMRVGDSLRRKVERGIDTAAYLIIVLSPDSVNSEWVSHELDAAFMKELEARRGFVLPVLHRDCNIPLLLRGKLYADFRIDRERGLSDVLASIDRSEVPDHSREEDISTYTDWTTDWRIEDGKHVSEIVINQHSKTDKWSVICYITGKPNETLYQRFQQYINNDLEWYAIAFSLNSIAATVSNEEEKTDVVYIDGALEVERNLGWRDPQRNAEMLIKIRARRLGSFANMDTLFEYGSIVRNIVDEQNRRNDVIIPKSEKEKLMRFLRDYPIDDPWQTKQLEGGSTLWLPR